MNEVLSRTNTIARLNDVLRTSLTGGKIVMTAGVAALTDISRARVLASVQTFSDFAQDNDPEGEHDFGAFEADGHACFWKIDYYDKQLAAGSPDPADPDLTTRVLTIMLRSEY